jgi:TrmH family RNA methyltransferase
MSLVCLRALCEEGQLTRRLFISSSSNPRLKAVRRLARQSSAEVFLAEGSRALRCALAAHACVREVYTAPPLYLGDDDAPLVMRAERGGARVFEVEPAAFRTIARHVRPDGVVALVDRPTTALAELELPPEPLVVAAVGIERPGNLGGIIRTACAANVDGLLVCDPCTDLFQRDVVRGSVGAIFHVPLAEAGSAEAIRWLRGRALKIVAATPGGTIPYWQADYGDGVAIVLGSERHGLSDAWFEVADETVAIPMPGPVDSLNVGVASGVVLFEAARRRARPLAAVTR